MPGSKALSRSLSLSEVTGRENSRKLSGTNYIVYALRFMSLTRPVFVVSTHRILVGFGEKAYHYYANRETLVSCCESWRSDVNYIGDI